MRVFMGVCEGVGGAQGACLGDEHRSLCLVPATTDAEDRNLYPQAKLCQEVWKEEPARVSSTMSCLHPCCRFLLAFGSPPPPCAVRGDLSWGSLDHFISKLCIPAETAFSLKVFFSCLSLPTVLSTVPAHQWH